MARLHTVVFRTVFALLVLVVGGMVTVTLTHARLLPVLTGSMSPTIPTHSLVLAMPVNPAAVKVGDVVVFRPPDGYLPATETSVMHRVVSLTTEDRVPVMRTRGDANPSQDPWSVDLRGASLFKVGFAVPYVGGLVQFLQSTTSTAGALTWPGLLTLAGVAAVAVRLRRRPGAPAVHHEPAGDLAREIHIQLSSIVDHAGALADCADPAHAQAAHDMAHHTRQLRVLADQVAALDPTGPHTSHRAAQPRTP